MLTHYNTPQHTATHYTTLQHTATQKFEKDEISEHDNTLQHTATHHTTLLHNATQFFEIEEVNEDDDGGGKVDIRVGAARGGCPVGERVGGLKVDGGGGGGRGLSYRSGSARKPGGRSG